MDPKDFEKYERTNFSRFCRPSSVLLGTLRSRMRRLLGRGDRAKAWNEDGVVSAGKFKLRFATRWGH